jgi:predicted aconitase with swiveling domain
MKTNNEKKRQSTGEAGKRIVLHGHMVNRGKAEGVAIVIREPFSFLGELDPHTGKLASPLHEQFGQDLKGKVLVTTTGKGSSMGPIISWYGMKEGNNPAAIICLYAEAILASAAITAGIPMVDKLDKNPFEYIRSGDYIKVDATNGVVEIMR